jgi:hypothetical protein
MIHTVIRADLAKHFKNTLKHGPANPFVTDVEGHLIAWIV